MIIGESGTGKELIANALHFNSLRLEKEFIKVNCSALPKELIEAELFGYVKGVHRRDSEPPGADRPGEGGSLMLDEISEMPMKLQPKLLRVLEERRFRPVGSTETFEADFRLICATNREPRKRSGRHDARRPVLQSLDDHDQRPAAARATKTCNCSPTTSSRSSRINTTARYRAFRKPPINGCFRTAGRATCAIAKTPSNAPCCWRKARA